MRDDFTIDKNLVALLVIDMQRHFCDKASSFFVPGSDLLAVKLRDLVDVFDQCRRPVIFTRHIDSEDPNNLMLRWWSEKIKEEDPMSHVVEVLDTKKGSVVVKNQYDGFLNTDMEKLLRAKGVKQVVVCGVLTNLCCETTARSAFMRGFEVYFVEDGTTTFSQEMHDAALINLSYGFARLMKVDDVIRSLQCSDR